MPAAKGICRAIDALNTTSAEFQQDADVAELLQFAKDEAAVDERKKVTEAVVEKARALIENDEYDQAVQLLEAELPEGAEEELGIALSQARHAATEYQKRLDGAIPLPGSCCKTEKLRKPWSSWNRSRHHFEGIRTITNCCNRRVAMPSAGTTLRVRSNALASSPGSAISTKLWCSGRMPRQLGRRSRVANRGHRG